MHFKATCDSFYQQRTVILNFSLTLTLFRHTTFFFFLASERLHLIVVFFVVHKQKGAGSFQVTVIHLFTA